MYYSGLYANDIVIPYFLTSRLLYTHLFGSVLSCAKVNVTVTIGDSVVLFGIVILVIATKLPNKVIAGPGSD